jgi:hypothetical protein
MNVQFCWDSGHWEFSDLRFPYTMFLITNQFQTPFAGCKKQGTLFFAAFFLPEPATKQQRRWQKIGKLAIRKYVRRYPAVGSGHTFISVWNRAGHKMLWSIPYCTIFITIWTLLIKFYRETFYANSLRRINSYVLCMKMRSSREWMRSSSRAWIRPSRVWMK